MNSYDLSGRTAVITGGASGIGYATAQRFIQSGALVEIWDLGEERVANAGGALSAAGAAVTTQQVDVSDCQAVSDAAERSLRSLGHVDILFNCAGITLEVCPMVEMSMDTWHRNIAVNLNSLFYCCRAFAPSMIERGWGRIINVASMAGKEGNAMFAAYSAAKGGAIAFTKSLGKELATTGVTVNAVAPALFDTPLARSATVGNPEALNAMREKIPMRRLGDVGEAAALVTWLASDDCSFTTGFTFDLSGGRATY